MVGKRKTFKNGTGDVSMAQLNYRIYPTGSPSESFTSLDLPFNTNLVNPGDQKWQSLAASMNLLTGLTDGNYTLEVYVSANTNEGDRFLSNGGVNYTATFSVVPEPSALALIAGPAVLGAFSSAVGAPNESLSDSRGPAAWRGLLVIPREN